MCFGNLIYFACTKAYVFMQLEYAITLIPCFLLIKHELCGICLTVNTNYLYVWIFFLKKLAEVESNEPKISSHYYVFHSAQITPSMIIAIVQPFWTPFIQSSAPASATSPAPMLLSMLLIARSLDFLYNASNILLL